MKKETKIVDGEVIYKFSTNEKEKEALISLLKTRSFRFNRHPFDSGALDFNLTCDQGFSISDITDLIKHQFIKPDSSSNLETFCTLSEDGKRLASAVYRMETTTRELFLDIKERIKNFTPQMKTYKKDRMLNEIITKEKSENKMFDEKNCDGYRDLAKRIFNEKKEFDIPDVVVSLSELPKLLEEDFIILLCYHVY